MELVGPVARLLAGATCRARLTGGDQLPMSGPAIVMVNHTSIVDVAPVLASLHTAGLRPSRPCGKPGCGTAHGHVRFLVSELVFRHPIVGPLARQAGSIEVGWQRSAPDALRAAMSTLDRGGIVGIYPEGDVSAAPDGSPRSFRTGLARLALHSGAPVLPLAHHDARRIGSGTVAESLRGAARSVLHRPPLRLHVGEPLTVGDYGGRSVAEVTTLLRARLVETWQALAADQPASAGRGWQR